MPRHVTFRGRKREFLVRKPDAGKPHVRFDERDVETEHGDAIEAPADERAGKQIGTPKPPRHISTLPNTRRDARARGARVASPTRPWFRTELAAPECVGGSTLAPPSLARRA